ncbi:MAG: PQQ-dependent sugar dehydrogenase [Gemmataceae bacterium]|nr:PQQ-dependent sugar dehydrogenase [Gemmataceae bacterium]
MRRASAFALSLVALGLLFALAHPDAAGQPVRKKSGIDRRVPWTTSKVIGSPEPPPPYKTERVFTKLKFEEPLDMTYAPGTNRLFVAERWGKIWSFVNKNDVAKADLALEIKPGTDSKGMPMKRIIYGFTLHPKFKDNGHIYVTWIPNPEKEGNPKGTRVSRFTMKGEPPVADLASEKVIIEWPNGGHNGGCLKFGPDGMLYIVTGDGSGIADELVIGQDLSSILAKMLRIDVDNLGGERRGVSPTWNYSVPKDNPFINTPRARPEVWAYGLRQLWRFSFDRESGDIWGGEVGQDLWEMVYRIAKGGNYGWSVMEGTHPFRPERKKGPTPILTPAVEHSHSDFRSITGGFIYQGKRLKELRQYYVYGDFDTGRIWAFLPGYSRSDPQPTTPVKPLFHRELSRTTHRIITWTEDADGELYYVDFTGGGIHQLVKDDKKDESAKFPRKLSETGIFASVKDHVVAPGVIPYSVNAQLWGDHAVKERFIAIPGNGQIGFDEITYPQPSPGSTPGWRFPDGAVLVKTFLMDMERGNPKSRKRLETRLLHFQQFPGTQEYGDQYWRGYTYKWNDEQTDAVLVDEKGLDLPLKIKVGDGFVQQNYRIPSRAECTLCHTNAHKFALGVATMQMNRDHIYVEPGKDAIRDGSVVANQLATLEHIGLFTKPLPEPPDKLPRLADYDDQAQSIEARARSYLHSNCAHCHIKWGGGNAEFKLLATLPLVEMGIVNVPPAHGNFKIDGAKLLVPGHPDKSILLHRMKITELGRMPHIGSRVVHDSAVRVVAEWIKGMKE